MSIPALIEEFVVALKNAGATSPFADWAQFEPATDEELAALAEEVGAELPDELIAWFSTVRCALPLRGNYDATSIRNVIERTAGTKSIDFSAHYTNITSWNDGRFDDGRLADTYWQPQWVAVAQDSCGNEYCFDLAPGPNGVIGQLIAMEFQDGQGPYLAPWPDLEGMLRSHLSMLADERFFLDDDGFIEFDY